MSGKCVKKFDKNGKYIKKFGRKGRGPGEFHSPFRIDVLPDGKLVVLDPNLNKCEVFDNENSHQVLVTNQPIGVAFITEKEIAVLQILNPLDFSAIQKYDIISGDSDNYENILFTNSFNDITVGLLPFINGTLLRTKMGELLYVPDFMNHFVSFTSKGKIEFARSTMDAIKLPTHKRESYDAVNLRYPREQISSLDASIGNGVLHIVSNKATVRTESGNSYAVDAYSLTNGNYLYSFKYKPAKKITRLYITDSRIYAITNLASVDVIDYELQN